MRGIIRDVQFNKKYIVISYDVFDGSRKVDEHTIEYEAGTEVPDEQSVRAALRSSLASYNIVRDLDISKLKEKLVGIDEDVQGD